MHIQTKKTHAPMLWCMRLFYSIIIFYIINSCSIEWL